MDRLKNFNVVSEEELSMVEGGRRNTWGENVSQAGSAIAGGAGLGSAFGPAGAIIGGHVGFAVWAYTTGVTGGF